jgi:hypothetical protein
MRGVPIWLAIPALALALALLRAQVATLHLPILGEHRWRESDTYSVAYNFAHESMDFFRPRVDFTRGRSGITGMEAPILPFVVACAMRLFGDAPEVARIIVWAVGMLGLWASLALVRRARDTGLAVGFLVAFSLSPMALFELRQIQPDGVTAMLSAVAAFFFFRFARLEKRRDFALGMTFFSIGVLAKAPGILLAPAMWWFCCAARPVPVRRLVFRALPFVIPLVLSLAWDRWAHHLTNAYSAGQSNFNLDFSKAQILKDVQDTGFLRNLFWFIFPCYVTNWVLFPATVVGIGAAFQPTSRRVSVAFLLWLLFASAFLVAFSSRLESHWYYADLVLVPMCYFAGFGLSEVLRLFARGPLREQPPVARWAALVVLVSLALVPLVAPFASGTLDASEAVGATGAKPDQSWMSDWHLMAFVMLLSLAVVAVQLLSRRLLWVLALVLLPPALLFGVRRGAHDAVRVLTWRTRTLDERSFTEVWLEKLRPMVDRYSTRSDLFVVDNDTPWWLHLPLRKGWCATREDVEKAGLAHYRTEGARFYLTYFDRDPPGADPNVRLLGSTPSFRLYCLDPGGCAPLH